MEESEEENQEQENAFYYHIDRDIKFNSDLYKVPTKPDRYKVTNEDEAEKANKDEMMKKVRS